MKSDLKQKYRNKRINAQKEGIEFNLCFDEFIQLLNEANVDTNDLHIKGYHLARYNDSGDYSINNCRFILYLDNYRERKVSERSRQSSRDNIIKFNESLTAEERSKRAKKASAFAKKKGGYGGENKLTEDVINKRLKIINNSDINLMKFGWVGKVSMLLNISHTQVKRFVDEHYTGDFYRRK